MLRHSVLLLGAMVIASCGGSKMAKVEEPSSEVASLTVKPPADLKGLTYDKLILDVAGPQTERVERSKDAATIDLKLKVGSYRFSMKLLNGDKVVAENTGATNCPTVQEKTLVAGAANVVHIKICPVAPYQADKQAKQADPTEQVDVTVETEIVSPDTAATAVTTYDKLALSVRAHLDDAVAHIGKAKEEWKSKTPANDSYKKSLACVQLTLAFVNVSEAQLAAVKAGQLETEVFVTAKVGRQREVEDLRKKYECAKDA